MHGFADGTHAQYVVAGEHRMHGGRTVGDVDLLENVHAYVVARIADGCFDEETIHLRFRQFVGAELFDRVLGGDDHERLRYRVGFAVNGDFLLFHDFEQCGLCFRRGSVDFVGKYDGCENRSFAVFEFAVLLVVVGYADHVGRQQIRSELDALERHVDGVGEASGQLCLACSGVVFKQNVSADDHGGGALSDRLLLADHDLGYAVDQFGELVVEFGDVGPWSGYHGRGHGRLRGLSLRCRCLYGWYGRLRWLGDRCRGLWELAWCRCRNWLRLWQRLLHLHGLCRLRLHGLRCWNRRHCRPVGRCIVCAEHGAFIVGIERVGGVVVRIMHAEYRAFIVAALLLRMCRQAWSLECGARLRIAGLLRLVHMVPDGTQLGGVVVFVVHRCSLLASVGRIDVF